jgi:hypothetical protein
MEKEDIISVQRAQEDVETSYNLLNNKLLLLLTAVELSLGGSSPYTSAKNK